MLQYTDPLLRGKFAPGRCFTRHPLKMKLMQNETMNIIYMPQFDKANVITLLSSTFSESSMDKIVSGHYK